MKTTYQIIFILSCACLGKGWSQDTEINIKERFQYHINKAQSEITVDGVIHEEEWGGYEVATDFWQKIPYFDSLANPKTEVKLCYNDDYLYVSAKCYQKDSFVITTLKRDVYWPNDGFAVVLDPLNTLTNSTLFGVSAAGVQWDATRTSTSDISSDWSTKWFAEVSKSDGYWSVELAIPFRVLRYKDGVEHWGINFIRNVAYVNEFHNWTAVPEGFWPPDAAFAGTLQWDAAPQRKKSNYNLIPYISAGVSKSQDDEVDLDADFGVDAKLAVSSALNLDVTYNPDFSQIEVDELVTNLTRFNIALPEKRTFFLENADVFSDFGGPGMRPFFSRRIGLNQNLQPVPILYGLRLTGNLDEETRIGVMNIHSRSTENSLAQNQTAISMKRQFGRSFVQGLFLNRTAFDGGEAVSGDYGRNASIEGVYQSDNGQQVVYGAMHHSSKEGITDDNLVFNFGGAFQNANWELFTDNFVFQKNYFADMGFFARVNNYDAARDTTIRVGYNSSYSSLEYRWRPRESWVRIHRIGVENLTIYNDDWSFNEQYNRLRYFVVSKNTSEYRLRLNYNAVQLLFPFSFTSGEPLPADLYRSIDVNAEYESDRRKALSVQASVRTGGFYNGRLSRLDLSANYRVQPWGNFSLGYQWNDLSFPDPYGATTITAWVSKIEIGFNRNLIWTTLFQYVDQSNYMGINSRLQWRFSPMSDIFLVYVDNYDVLDGMMGEATRLLSNNRALVFKINYWY